MYMYVYLCLSHPTTLQLLVSIHVRWKPDGLGMCVMGQQVLEPEGKNDRTGIPSELYESLEVPARPGSVCRLQFSAG